MGIAAIPQGVEIKKLTKTQERALDKLLKAQRDQTALQTAIKVAVPTLAFVGVAGLGIVTTYAYLKDIDVKEIVSNVSIDAGGAVADALTNIIGRVEPKTPEFTPSGAGPIPRCKRWETDYVSTVKDNPTAVEIVLFATTQLNIIKNMKAEGCSRPTVIPQSQWDKV